MIIIGVLTSGNDNSSKPVPAASVSESGNSGGDTIKPQTIVGDNRFGCVDRDYFEKLGSYAVDKDNVAFSNALSLGVINGECVLSKRTSRYSLPIPLYSRVL